jgi:YVTN family beta-propeller protein
VLDADSLELQATIPVGKRVWGIALSRDGSQLYTCNGIDSTVSVVDTAARKEIAKIPVGGLPWGVVLDD